MDEPQVTESNTTEFEDNVSDPIENGPIDYSWLLTAMEKSGIGEPLISLLVPEYQVSASSKSCK